MNPFLALSSLQFSWLPMLALGAFWAFATKRWLLGLAALAVAVTIFSFSLLDQRAREELNHNNVDELMRKELDASKRSLFDSASQGESSPSK